CFIEKLGDWCPEILPNQKVFFRISLRKCRPLKTIGLEALFHFDTSEKCAILRRLKAHRDCR
ncbi:hypothetical protein, partial [Pseudomonas sp. FSL R10-0399]